MRRHPSKLLQRLLYGALLILAAMHPDAVTTIARLAAGMVLATVNGITALQTAGALYIAYQIRTHRPRPARARA